MLVITRGYIHNDAKKHPQDSTGIHDTYVWLVRLLHCILNVLITYIYIQQTHTHSTHEVYIHTCTFAGLKHERSCRNIFVQGCPKPEKLDFPMENGYGQKRLRNTCDVWMCRWTAGFDPGDVPQEIGCCSISNWTKPCLLMSKSRNENIAELQPCNLLWYCRSQQGMT